MKRFAIFLLVLLAASVPVRAASGDEDDEVLEHHGFADDACDNVCFPRYNGGIFTCHLECKSEDDVEFPTGMDFIVKKVREMLPPPMLKSAETAPPEPQAGGDVEIKLFPAAKDFDDYKDYEVIYVYSFDSTSNWNALRPVLDPAGGFWKTTLAIPENAGALYSAVRIGDTEKNTYIETPCPVRGEVEKTDDCYFPLWKDESYEGVKNFTVNPSLDLLDAKVGMDEKKFYFKITMRAAIDPGVLVPSSVNYYLIGIYDPDRPSGADPYHRTSFVIYSPYLYKIYEHSRANPKLFGDSGACKTVVRMGADWIVDIGAVRCVVQGNTLFVAAKRATLGGFVTGTFVSYAATGIIFDEFNGVISDYSPAAAVRFDKQPIKIKK